MIMMNQAETIGHESIGAMMQHLAQQAVVIAKDFGVDLDGSGESLSGVEAILTALQASLRSGESKPSDDEMAMMCKLWGAYLGEVMRAAVGGEWVLEPPPETKAPAPALNIRGSLVFPTLKIFRRLTLGSAENVVDFYGLVIARMHRDTVH